MLYRASSVIYHIKIRSTDIKTVSLTRDLNPVPFPLEGNVIQLWQSIVYKTIVWYFSNETFLLAFLNKSSERHLWSRKFKRHHPCVVRVSKLWGRLIFLRLRLSVSQFVRNGGEGKLCVTLFLWSLDFHTFYLKPLSLIHITSKLRILLHYYKLRSNNILSAFVQQQLFLTVLV